MDIKKQEKFLDWLSNKLQTNIGEVIGKGVDGVVYNIGRKRVLKLSTANIKETYKLVNENIPGVCKIYSVGEITVPKRYVVKEWHRYGLSVSDSVIGSSYSKNITVYYIIMEELDSKKAASDLDYYVKSVVDSYFSNNHDMVDKYGFFDHEYKIINSIYIINKQRNNEDFLTEIIDYADDYFSTNGDYEKFQSLLSDLIEIFNNVGKLFVWEDVHKGQFGYDSHGNLKAFDIDSTFNVDLDYDYSKPRHLVREQIKNFSEFNKKR